MRKYTSRAQQPGVCADGLPNRALRRHQPQLASALVVNAFRGWYMVAARLCGYIPPVDENEEKAA